MRRGVSERAIRKRIAAGDLAGAILPDGTIDPDAADRLLDASTTAGAQAPVRLSDAKRRKLAAQVADLREVVAELLASVCTNADAVEVISAQSRIVAARLIRIAECAPAVAGKPTSEVFSLLTAEVYAALNELADHGDAAAVPDREPPSATDRTASAVDLAAIRADLLAERLEVRRALRHGEVIRVAQVTDEFLRRCTNVRTRALALPSKLAPHLASTKDIEAVRAILRAEVNDVVAQLDCEYIAADELIGATNGKELQ